MCERLAALSVFKCLTAAQQCLPESLTWQHCLRGGCDWQSRRKRQILALGAMEVPAARRMRALTPLEGAHAAVALTAAPTMP